MRRTLAAALVAISLTALPASAQLQPLSPGAVAPITVDDCPATHPIKGNNSGRQAERPVDPIYHTPSSRWYAATDPEECFATVEEAEAAGYRAPLR
jgi:hypothetical protein